MISNKSVESSFTIYSPFTFSFIPFKEYNQVYFESFGNVDLVDHGDNSLNGTSVTTDQLLINNDSNYSNFTFKNSITGNHKSQIDNFNTNKSISQNDSVDCNVDINYNNYMKLTNEDVISKIKSKLTASTRNILSNNNKEQSLNEKQLNDISFKIDNTITAPQRKIIDKHKQRKQTNKNDNSINNSKSIISSTRIKGLSQFINNGNVNNNELGNSPSAPSKELKEDNLLYSNRTLSGKRPKKTHKTSNSIDIKYSKKHLNDISVSTVSTFSSKRNYRNNSNRISNKNTPNEYNNTCEEKEAKKRTKIFYKNIKNIKSKYNSIINSNGNNHLYTNEINQSNQMKGIHLEQYINTKIN